MTDEFSVVYVTAKSLYCVSPEPCGLGARLTKNMVLENTYIYETIGFVFFPYLGLLMRPIAGEASDDLQDMERLPRTHMVADHYREKDGAAKPCQSVAK